METFLPTRIIPTLVTDQFLLPTFKRGIHPQKNCYHPYTIVEYVITLPKILVRSNIHTRTSCSRLFSVPVEARRTMTAGASRLLMTVEYIIIRKKKKETRDLIVRP